MILLIFSVFGFSSMLGVSSVASENAEPIEVTRSSQGGSAQEVDPYSSLYDDYDIYGKYDEYDHDAYEMNGSEYEDHFMDDWEAIMHNFNPDLLVTCPISSRSDEFFYEDVKTVGTLIRGAYFVVDSLHESGHSGVDFVVTNPEGDIIYEKRDKVEGVFNVTANTTGTYAIMIGNHKWVSSKQVTVLIGVGEHKALKSTDINSITDGISQIDSTIKEIQSESSYLWIKQKSHMKEVASINSKVFWYHFIEFAVLIGVSTVQIYYVRRLLSSRRLF